MLAVEGGELGEEGLEQERLVREPLEGERRSFDPMDPIDDLVCVAGVGKGVAVHAGKGAQREAELRRAGDCWSPRGESNS